MSKIALVSPASGTATFSIEAPVGSTDRTLTLPDSAGTIATAESTLAQFNASGSAPVYACRAWVNFNGTGTVAIRASGNVSSITDNGTGQYTVNFTTAMPDANYAVASSGGYHDGFDARIIHNIDTDRTQTSAACHISSVNPSGTYIDPGQRIVAIFR